MQQSSSIPKTRGGCRRLLHVPNPPLSAFLFWHGVIPSFLMIFTLVYIYLGDLVGLLTTNDSNLCNCGVCGVGGTGDFPLFRCTLTLVLLSGSVGWASSLADSPYNLETMSAASVEGTSL